MSMPSRRRSPYKPIEMLFWQSLILILLIVVSGDKLYVGLKAFQPFYRPSTYLLLLKTRSIDTNTNRRGIEVLWHERQVNVVRHVYKLNVCFYYTRTQYSTLQLIEPKVLSRYIKFLAMYIYDFGQAFMIYEYILQKKTAPAAPVFRPLGVEVSKMSSADAYSTEYIILLMYYNNNNKY